MGVVHNFECVRSSRELLCGRGANFHGRWAGFLRAKNVAAGRGAGVKVPGLTGGFVWEWCTFQSWRTLSCGSGAQF